MTDVTAQAFREAAAQLNSAIRGESPFLKEIEALLLAAAEQREQWDVCLAEWPKRYESPPWRSLERMYQEAYPGRDVVISDVLRWADTFIAARREQVSIIRTLEAEIATLTAERDNARAQFAQAVERLEDELERAEKGHSDE